MRPCSGSARSHHKGHTAMVASLVTLSVFIAALLLSFVCFRFYSRGRRQICRNEKEDPRPKSNYRKKELQEMTNALNGENIIGSSSGSIVYRGGNIAVTVYTDVSDEYNFFNHYVYSLLKIRHGNLLSVVGFCREESFKALVTEYEPNGNLDTLMHAATMEERRMTFDLSKRIDVLISTAAALIHLHENCAPSIIHGHLRPTNIYLDEQFRVRVGEFGTLDLLREHLMQERRAFSPTEGTNISYLAPELADGMVILVTPKADVFSVGVILMEMMTGIRAPTSLESASGAIVSLRQWIEKGVNGGSVGSLVDPALPKSTSDKESEGKKIANLFEISLRCTEASIRVRPNMGQVLAWLDNIKHGRVEYNTRI